MPLAGMDHLVGLYGLSVGAAVHKYEVIVRNADTNRKRRNVVLAESEGAAIRQAESGKVEEVRRILAVGIVCNPRSGSLFPGEEPPGLKRAKVGEPLTLQHERGNPHSERDTAVRVSNSMGQFVGYVPGYRSEEVLALTGWAYCAFVVRREVNVNGIDSLSMAVIQVDPTGDEDAARAAVIAELKRLGFEGFAAQCDPKRSIEAVAWKPEGQKARAGCAGVLLLAALAAPIGLLAMLI